MPEKQCRVNVQVESAQEAANTVQNRLAQKTLSQVHTSKETNGVYSVRSADFKVTVVDKGGHINLEGNCDDEMWEAAKEALKSGGPSRSSTMTEEKIWAVVDSKFKDNLDVVKANDLENYRGYTDVLATGLTRKEALRRVSDNYDDPEGTKERETQRPSDKVDIVPSEKDYVVVKNEAGIAIVMESGEERAGQDIVANMVSKNEAESIAEEINSEIQEQPPVNKDIGINGGENPDIILEVMEDSTVNVEALGDSRTMMSNVGIVVGEDNRVEMSWSKEGLSITEEEIDSIMSSIERELRRIGGK